MFVQKSIPEVWFESKLFLLINPVSSRFVQVAPVLITNPSTILKLTCSVIGRMVNELLFGFGKKGLAEKHGADKIQLVADPVQRVNIMRILSHQLQGYPCGDNLILHRHAKGSALHLPNIAQISYLSCRYTS